MLICLDQRTGTGCATENQDGAQFCRQCGRSLRFALQLRNPSDVVGAYRVVSVIGHGGFGAVYLAEALQQPGQRVALKETFDPDQIQSYQAEFAVLARLQHPHLPRYHTVFEADGNGYLVMEYVPGQSLQEVLDRQQGPLLEAQVLGYAIQLCDALAFLHSQNPPIVHRDIKPANVRLTPEGLIKLVDFGLVKEGSGATRSSRRGVTPAYAPPEQWGLGGQHTDPRSDIYALGATLYHLLTGQEPPAATDRISATPDPLAAPRTVNRSISDAVAGAVTGAMAMSVAQRPADALALKRLLLQQGAPVQAPPVHPPAPAVPRPAPQKPTPAITLTVREFQGIRFVYVPAGEFWMGSDKARDPQARGNELPEHRVHLSDFWIMETPVTNAHYVRGVLARACKQPNNGRWQTTSYANHPVTDVDWSQANAFAAWLSGRLPTEAEWEKAARGTDRRIYPWGNVAPDKRHGNFNNDEVDTTPVGRYPGGASPFGLLDMAGNVWEWTSDWYEDRYYASSPSSDPRGAVGGDWRVLRGGAFCYDVRCVRCAYRGWDSTYYRASFSLGFRVVIPGS
jgi:formylglycine-generating enzyme required for sulfatase activity